MTNIKSLQSLLDWKLLPGSHAFPGPDGGTCINEAALVVAGWPYAEVTLDDMPLCICPVLGRYAMYLNDLMDDDERQRLVPYVPRLVGSRDDASVEEREQFIIWRLRARAENPIYPAINIYGAVQDINRLAQVEPSVWYYAIATLARALDIGKQAEPIDTSVMLERIRAAKASADQRLETALCRFVAECS